MTDHEVIQHLISAYRETVFDSLKRSWWDKTAADRRKYVDDEVRRLRRQDRHVGYWEIERCKENSQKQAEIICNTVWANEVYDDLDRSWDERVKQLNLPALVIKFRQRHPWLAPLLREENTSIDDTLIYQFISEYIDQRIRNVDVEGAFTPVTRTTWKSGNYLSKLVEENSLLRYQLNDFPLRQFWKKNDKQCLLLPNVSDLSHHGGPAYSNYQLSRADIYFLLGSKFKVTHSNQSDTTGAWGAKQKVLPISPVELSELQFLDPLSLTHCDTWLVNLHSPTNPFWIAVHRVQGKYIAYLPEGLATDPAYQQQLAILNQALPITDVVSVDLAGNQGYADIPKDKVWQYHLVGRVMPYCLLNTPTMPFDQYRSDISLYHLVAFFWESLADNTRLTHAKTAFQFGRPLTESNWSQLLSQPFKTAATFSPNPYLIADAVLKAIDEKRVNIEWTDAGKTDKRIHASIEGSSWLVACFMAAFEDSSQMYLTLNQQSLAAMPDTPYYLLERVTNNLISVGFDCQEGVTPRGFPPLVQASNKAARNRLLLCDGTPIDIYTTDGERWRLAAKQMLSLIQSVSNEMDVKGVQRYLSLKATWQAQWFQQKIAPVPATLEWQYAQFGQMGKLGMDALFDYLWEEYLDKWQSKYQTPTLGLNALFDLNGDGLNTEADFISHLKTRLIDLLDNNRCTPKFQTLQFILPQSFGRAAQRETANLIQAVNQAKYQQPKETEAVVLHAFLQLNESMREAWMGQLETLARQDDHPLIVMISIPEFDKMVSSDITLNQWKTRYRALQNQILENRRSLHQAKLPKQTAAFYQAIDGRLDAVVELHSEKHIAVQPFDGEDEHFLLSGSPAGIQQALQQNVEASHQVVQQVEVQRVVYREGAVQIEPYQKSLKGLVTRDNIEAKYGQSGKGIKKYSMRQRFNQWVGSEENAESLIQFIEPEAMAQLLLRPDDFCMGVVPGHLPFGFYLSEHPDGNQAWILCFNEQRMHEDRYEWQRKVKEAQNPFVLHQDKKWQAETFQGDYRQFSLLPEDEVEAQLNFWRYMAHTTLDDQQLIKQRACLRNELKNISNLSDEDVNVLMAAYEVTGQGGDVGTVALLKASLTDWADTVLADKKDKQDFYEQFIEDLTNSQLSAFGQLFYYYDGPNGTKGSEHFLRIAYEMYHTFGAENFAIWQSTTLGKSHHAGELLEKPILDAMAYSLVTLKDKSKIYTDIWFQLLQKHGSIHDRCRYDRLWLAYQALIGYIDDHQLTISAQLVEQLLQSHDEFHAVVWLDRVYQCLILAEGQLYESVAQQAMLDNLNAIDWQANGLFYAMQYNQMPYWSADMALTQFQHATSEVRYFPQWDKDIAPQDLMPLFGRYLAGRLNINYQQYQHYIDQLKPVMVKHAVSKQTARLLLIHLTYGGDSITDWTSSSLDTVLTVLQSTENQRWLDWVNQQFELDAKLGKSSYQVSLRHLPLLCQVFAKSDQSALEKLGKTRARSLLNAFGKTCEYLDSQHQLDKPIVLSQLTAMVSMAIKHVKYRHAMQQTPWLVMSDFENWQAWPEVSHQKHQQAVQQLFEQLTTIHYQSSTWFPDREAIEQAIRQLSTTTDGGVLANIRRGIISDWVAKGCHIRSQDATFRALETTEKDTLKQLIHDQLLPQHIDNNMPLLEKLASYLAIEANLVKPESCLFEFVAQLKRIDNKRHFNDLGIVLGQLVRYAQSNQPGKMSVPQLTQLFDSLMLESHDELSHFPSDMLADLLLQAGPGLLNQNLNELKATVEAKLHGQVNRIVAANIVNEMKPYLVQLLPTPTGEQALDQTIECFAQLKKDKVSLSYQADLASILLETAQISSVEDINLYQMLLQHPQNDDALKVLWLQARRQLLQTANRDKSLNCLRYIQPLVAGDANHIAMEIIGSHTQLQNMDEALALKEVLLSLEQADIEALAKYCAHPPKPSAAYLIKSLPDKSVAELIHHFETIDQAKDLRQYSVSEAEQAELMRVLRGIKEKGKGFVSDSKQKEVMGYLYYVNAYAQEQNLAEIPSSDLTLKIRETARYLKKSANADDQMTYRLQMQAMLREVLLRQTGKWANHTQMLDLIYACMHSNDSLFHQVKTGQGKSIITIMRVAFHALNGFVVDVYTSKESLSGRDHANFGHILDALGIPHAHVLPNDDETAYQLGGDDFGAVNYMTPGSFSLFQSGQCWAEGSRRPINYCAKNRIAYFDEGDHVLLDETTVFNFSHSGDVGQIYNYDAWVYQTTWQYFSQIKDEIPINDKGVPYISRKKHLQALCQLLQQQAVNAPVQSTFVDKYLSPVLDEDNAAAITERDKVLAHLMTAAYTASCLQNHKDYCIQPSSTTLTGGVTLAGRTAKVVIKTQVQGEATYAEDVQQFLHVRLNAEAVALGQAPDFFIAPKSDIALSQNVASLIEQYYSQIEGCSGTMGDAGDLAVYLKRYGIDHVVKLPTHEVSQTNYLGMVFCEGETARQQAIIACLQDHRQQPTLLVSEDDIAVKNLSEQILKQLPQDMQDKWICDTNDSGLAEKDIVPRAGQAGVIVNSARMARGTDIKPETEAGLLVIRSNPDIPRFLKQSGGRQGRNGAKGVLVDIIDYAKVRQSYEQFEQSPNYRDRLEALMQREIKHLDEKLARHQRKRSQKWRWVREKDKRDKYLKTRVVQFLKHEIKLAKEKNMRSKEALVAACSGQVLQTLMQYVGEDNQDMRALRKDWLQCLRTIESAWQQRMAGADEDNDAVFDLFYEKSKAAWHQFAKKHEPEIRPELLDDKQALFASVHAMSAAAWNEGDDVVETPREVQKQDMAPAVACYQHWLANIGPFVQAQMNPSQRHLFYGKTTQGLNQLNAFYRALVKASQSESEALLSKDVSRNSELFETIKKLPLPVVCYVPLQHMTRMVEALSGVRAQDNFSSILACLPHLFTQSFVNPVDDLTSHHMVVLGESMSLLTRLSCVGYVDKTSPDYRRFTTEQAINHISQALSSVYWETLTPNQFTSIDHFLTQSDSVARLLTTRLSGKQWQGLIGQLRRYDMSKPRDKAYLTKVCQYFETHQALLNGEYHESLSSLLDIFLYYPHRRVDATQFPAPNCLSEVSIDSNIRYVHFLAEQVMITPQQAGQLTQMINNGFRENQAGHKKMTKDVMPKIETLPANIPFSMIVKRVQTATEDHDTSKCLTAMGVLEVVGKALNQFTNQKKITTPDNPLPPEGAQKQALERAQVIVTKADDANDLQVAITFLETCRAKKYQSLTADVCLKSYEYFGEQYKEVLDGLAMAQKCLDTDVFEQLCEACFDEAGVRDSKHWMAVAKIFDDNQNRFDQNAEMRKAQQVAILSQCATVETFQVLQQRLEWLNHHKLSLSTPAIWKIWQVTDDLDALKTKLSVMPKMTDLSLVLQQGIARAVSEGLAPEKADAFIVLAQADKKEVSPLGDDEMQAIFALWQAGTIRDQTHLSEVMASQRLADWLASETKQNAEQRHNDGQLTMASVFGDFSKNMGARRHLMHSIAHGLIQTKSGIEDKLWQAYTNFTNKVGDVKNRIDALPENQQATGLRGILMSVKGLTMELAVVAKPTPDNTAKATQNWLAEVVDDEKTDYATLLKEYQAAYPNRWYQLKAWTISNIRHQQAATFFTKIDESVKNKTVSGPDMFYDNMLAIIQATQKDIIGNDKDNRVKNKKGYSRLLNITQQLGLQVCQDMMLSSQVSPGVKQKARDWLETQRDDVVNQLHLRLPRKHPLDEQIQAYQANPNVTITAFKQYVKTVTPESLPKEVRYLLPLLQGHMADTSEAEISLSTANKSAP